MKHEAMKAYETQGSSLEWRKEGRTPHVQGRIRMMSLGATLEGGEGH
jgi:hypothetical protein